MVYEWLRWCGCLSNGAFGDEEKIVELWSKRLWLFFIEMEDTANDLVSDSGAVTRQTNAIGWRLWICSFVIVVISTR